MSDNHEVTPRQQHSGRTQETPPHEDLAAAIRLLEERCATLESAMRAADGVAYQVDLRTNQVTFASDQIKSLTGYRADELTDRVWAKMIRSSEVHAISASSRCVPIHVQLLSSPFTEFGIRTKRKEDRWLAIKSNAILSNEGAVVGAVGMLQEITDAVSARHYIRQQYDRLTALRAIDVTVLTSTDLGETLTILLNQVQSLLKVDAATILVMNRHTFELEFAKGVGLRSEVDQSPIPIGSGVAGFAAQIGSISLSSDVPEGETDPYRSDLIAREGFAEYFATPLMARGAVLGVMEVFHRSKLTVTPDWRDFLDTLAGQAAVAIESNALFQGLQRANQELKEAYDSTIEGWVHALDMRDKETEGHSRRVTEMAVKLAKAMGTSDDELVHVRRGALLHDIGKMGIPDHILHKPSELSEAEWDVMKRHPVYAYEMLSAIAYLRPTLDIPYAHHEKWNGSGYPLGLKGTEIPLAARIFAVIDVYDALTNERPYRAAWTEEAALAYIRDHAGVQFDPEVVRLFLQMKDKG